MRRILVVLVAAVATATVMLIFGAASAQEREREDLESTTPEEESTTVPENTEEDFTVNASSEDTVSSARLRRFTKFAGNTTGINIPTTGDFGQASPYPSTDTFSLSKRLKRPRITDVNLTINGWLQGGFPEHVDVLLVGPQGQNAIVLSDVCAGGPATQINVTLKLDDEAAAPIPGLAGNCTSGTFKPTNLSTPIDSFPLPAPTPTGNALLSVFDGTNPKGTWSLYAVDDGTPDGTGAFQGGWSLEIKGKARRR